MLRLLGYTDRLSAAPGDTIRFMVSSDHDRYAAGSSGSSTATRTRPVRASSRSSCRRRSTASAAGPHQDLPSGSSAKIPVPARRARGRTSRSRSSSSPTAPGGGEQVIAEPRRPVRWRRLGAAWSRRDGRARAGHRASRRRRRGSRRAIALPRVALVLRGADGRGRGCARSSHLPWRDPGADAAAGHPPRDVRRRPDRGRHGRAGPRGDGRRRPANAALRRSARPAAADRPGAVDEAACSTWPTRRTILDDVAADLIGAWDFSLDIAERPRSPTSRGHDRHGTTINLPTRGVTGHDFTGEETDLRRRPGEYGAIHFHRDDLEDAGWEADFELTIPADLPSGHLRRLAPGRRRRGLPAVHGPAAARHAAVADRRADVDRDLRDVRELHRHRPRRLARGRLARRPDRPSRFADPRSSARSTATSSRALAVRHVRHPRGRVGRLLRLDAATDPQHAPEVPLPDARAAPARFPADLYLVDWLDQKGIEVDYLTDHDLLAEGADLLRPYTVVAVELAPRVLDAPGCSTRSPTYLGGGGRFMYIGGNSAVRRASSVDPDRPHVARGPALGAPLAVRDAAGRAPPLA